MLRGIELSPARPPTGAANAERGGGGVLARLRDRRMLCLSAARWHYAHVLGKVAARRVVVKTSDVGFPQHAHTFVFHAQAELPASLNCESSGTPQGSIAIFISAHHTRQQDRCLSKSVQRHPMSQRFGPCPHMFVGFPRQNTTTPRAGHALSEFLASFHVGLQRANAMLVNEARHQCNTGTIPTECSYSTCSIQREN